MAELDRARARLEQAVWRLETALQDVNLRGGASAELAQLEAERDALAREVSDLKAERDRLAKELEGTRADNATLQEVTDDVSARLGAAIGELKSVLEG